MEKTANGLYCLTLVFSCLKVSSYFVAPYNYFSENPVSITKRQALVHMKQTPGNKDQSISPWSFCKKVIWF